MHFSIPDTVVKEEEKGNNYTAYCVHVNGVYHCELRFRQLHSLHEQLRKEFGGHTIPPFPPKKIFNLNLAELEERRSQLETYLQLISKDPRISNCQTFNNFLLMGQQETRRQVPENVTLHVFLMNEHKVSVLVSTVEHTDSVLEKVCSQLGIPEDYHYCFSLYLIHRDEDGDITVLRKLQDFESPFISQKALSNSESSASLIGSLKIVIRKSCWDTRIDDLLLSEPSSLNLLYIQTLADIERGWVLTSQETKQQLALMQARGAKRQYMEVARSLKFYGYMVFRPAISDYPEPHTRATVALGKATLNMRVYTPSGEVTELAFKVTRIRCWRIMTITATGVGGSPANGLTVGSGVNGNANKSLGTEADAKLELSFEYLLSTEKLKWIRIVSSQAILMSVCLQSMVEELVRLKSGETDPKRLTRCTAKASIKERFGGVDESDGCSSGPVDYTVKKLAEKFTVVNMKTASRAAEDVFVENEIFGEPIAAAESSSSHSINTL